MNDGCTFSTFASPPQNGQGFNSSISIYRLFFFRRAFIHGSVIGDPSGRLYLHRGHRQIAHSQSMYPGDSQRSLVPHDGQISDLFMSISPPVHTLSNNYLLAKRCRRIFDIHALVFCPARLAAVFLVFLDTPSVNLLQRGTTTPGIGYCHSLLTFCDSLPVRTISIQQARCRIHNDDRLP